MASLRLGRIDESFYAVVGALERAVAANTPVILPLWKPYHLNVVYRLRVLADPKNVLGGANRVVLGARSEVVGLIDEATTRALRSTGLTLDIVSELDRRIHAEGQSPDKVAADWVSLQLDVRSRSHPRPSPHPPSPVRNLIDGR